MTTLLFPLLAEPGADVTMLDVAAVRMMAPHFGDIIFVLGSYKDRGGPAGILSTDMGST